MWKAKLPNLATFMYNLVILFISVLTVIQAIHYENFILGIIAVTINGFKVSIDKDGKIEN